MLQVWPSSPAWNRTGRISFSKTQNAEIEGSFNHATGVSNVNSAAGNLNNQTAYTTISIGSIGSGGELVKKVTSY